MNLDKCLFCHSNIVINAKFCGDCGKQVPQNDTQWIITNYFRQGLTYDEIINMLLLNFNIAISLRTLKSRLKEYGLYRKKPVLEEDFDILTTAIEEKITGSGSRFGYRAMWHSLRLKGINAPRDLVMQRLKEIDPAGTADRKRKKLQRRLYNSPGPNFCWHIDGYDKLKPFGFPIHGCIDGFSRKIIWLEIVTSNNNPHIIADLYLKSMEKLEVMPKIVRSDNGTENVIVAASQEYLFESRGAHVFGSSHSNQRIEGWWSYFRKCHSSSIIDFFKDLVSEGIYNTEDFFQKVIVRYLFTDLLKKELKNIIEHWNTHYIRHSRYNDVYGRPDVLYCLNENYGEPIDEAKVNQIKNVVLENIPVERDERESQFFDYLDYVSSEINLRKPQSLQEGRQQFLQLLQMLED